MPLCLPSPPPPTDGRSSNSSKDLLPGLLLCIYSHTHLYITTRVIPRLFSHITAIILYVLFCNLLFSLPSLTCYLYLLCFPKDLRSFTRVPAGRVGAEQRREPESRSDADLDGYPRSATRIWGTLRQSLNSQPQFPPP